MGILNENDIYAILDRMEKDLEMMKNEWVKPSDDTIRGAQNALKGVRDAMNALIKWKEN